MINRIFDVELWRQLLQSDFNRGYVAAIVMVLALLCALFILRFLLWCVFRTRRCQSVTVPHKDGDVIVSRDALTEVVARELRAFPELEVRKIRLFRRGGSYLMTLLCTFGGCSGAQQLIGELKPRLVNTLNDTFGITTLKSIKVVIEKLAVSAAEPAPKTPASTPEADAADNGEKTIGDAADPGL